MTFLPLSPGSAYTVPKNNGACTWQAPGRLFKPSRFTPQSFDFSTGDSVPSYLLVCFSSWFFTIPCDVSTSIGSVPFSSWLLISFSAGSRIWARSSPDLGFLLIVRGSALVAAGSLPVSHTPFIW